MAQETNPPYTTSSIRPGSEERPPEVAEVLGKVGKLLEEGQPKKALEVISQTKVKSPWTTNAAGVCQLRLGNANIAVDVFRGLVLAAGGLILREDVPTAFKTNYATALLVADNLSGFHSVLAEVKDKEHPAVQKLHTAMQRWKTSLTLWQKIQWYTGGHPARPMALDSPLGDLE